MDERRLLKLSLALSLIGLTGLIVLSGYIPEAEYSKYSPRLDRELKLRGRIIRVTDGEKVAFLELEYPERVDVAVFKPGRLPLRQNESVQLTGVLEEYKGRLGLVAYRIEKLEKNPTK